MRRIVCGCAHSAAITSYGELYTWGRGKNGWLGHGKFIYNFITVYFSTSCMYDGLMSEKEISCSKKTS